MTVRLKSLTRRCLQILIVPLKPGFEGLTKRNLQNASLRTHMFKELIQTIKMMKSSRLYLACQREDMGTYPGEYPIP